MLFLCMINIFFYHIYHKFSLLCTLDLLCTSALYCVHAVYLRNFPKIKQKETNWCILAAVENVVKFHGGNILQHDIYEHYIEKFHHIENIDFDKVKDILEHHFAKEFSYRILNKHTSKIIGRTKDVISLIKNGICHDLSPILLVELPTCWYLPSYSTHCDHYAFTALGYSQNSILIWDTNPNIINIPVVVENEWVEKHLSSDLTTFWVIPNEKVETFENLIEGVLA